jgi:hypothetical protein
MILESLILPAILPAAIDALKTLFGGISRKIGGLSADDQIKLDNSNIEKLKALASLDTVVGVPSQWVVDTRASFRYVGAALSILSGLALIFYKPEFVEVGYNLIAAPYGFIFGERLYFGMTGRGK